MTDDSEIVERLAIELQAIAGRPIEFCTTPERAFGLIGCLQLAYRYPDLSETQRELIWTFVKGLRQPFADCPTAMSVIEMGWDRRHDR